MYTDKNLALVKAGIENLKAHIETVRKSGVPVVVCLNSFYTDHNDEIELIKTEVEAAGAKIAVSRHWELGGKGAEDLAKAVVMECDKKNDFSYLYSENDSIEEKIKKIACSVYGADKVAFSSDAQKKIDRIETDPELASLGTCMVKTHLSLSHDPDMKGRPTGWTLPIRDILVYQGAGFIVPVAGDIKLMPGTASDPAYRRIDIDMDTGKVKGLF